MSGYDAEQEQLRDRFEGKEEPKIEVPKDFPEVNPEIYKDVEPLLFRGFLHVPAEINGVQFVFKSLNHHEFDLIKLMMPVEGATTREAVSKFHNYFLSHGVFMVDGVNVLSDRDRMFGELVEFFESFNGDVITKIVRCLSDLNRRANRAVTLTEAYAMEVSSRLRWTQFKQMDLTGTAVTGIKGTSSLGLNWAQLTWLAINRYEDIREQSEREWENAKFVASAMAGKGMSRIHNQDKRRRESEKAERIERRDRVLRFAILGESMDKEKVDRAHIKVARTTEDLALQMKRDLSGEKDFHDRVIEALDAQTRKKLEEQQNRYLELQAQHAEEFGELAISGGTPLKGMTPDQARNYSNRQRQLQYERLNIVAQERPELFDEKLREHNEKWSSIKPTPETEVPLIPQSKRPVGVPFKTGK